MLPEARAEASQDIITLFKVSELSRVETETVSYHWYYRRLQKSMSKPKIDDRSTEIFV